MKTIKDRIISQIVFCSCVTQNMASNLVSRLGQLEEQRKTIFEGTRRLLDTVNSIKDTGKLLLQMLEMSRRLENLMNDAKMEIKMETISVTRKIGG